MIILLVILPYFGFRIFAEVLLFQYAKKDKREKKVEDKQLINLPQISIIVPIKSPAENITAAVKALLQQDYAGNFEIIFAIKDIDDPAIAETKKIVSETKSRAVAKWALGDEGEGLNPKNSNLARGIALSTYPWLYISDADTVPAQNHLTDLVSLSKNDATKFVTTVSVHENPRTLGAKLECVGTNFEAIPFFLISYLDKKCGVLNGAGSFFHKNLLNKVGGISASLNTLTDDLFYGKLFVKAGAEGVLATHFARVDLHHQTVVGFISRQVRWMMIAKFFKPEIFWLAPLFWPGFWLLVFAVVTTSSTLIKLATAAFIFRTVEAFFLQRQVGIGLSHSLDVLVLPLYDLLVPFLWLTAVFKKSVVWGGSVLQLRKNGMLYKSR